MDGTSLNANWPVVIDATPSVTPSAGDIDGDGNKEIILCSYNDILAFDLNGALKAGFPVLNTNTTFSYQSPLLVDLDGDGTLNIVGSTIGDVPEFYVLNHDGTYHSGWPVAVPDANWTYCPPAVADLNQNGNYRLFFTRPVNDTVLPILYGFDKNAVALSNFPMSARGGDEGIITIADVDGDLQYEIVTGSNLCDGESGFIHAFKMDGSGEAAGFPLRPQGFSFMNGANLADINNDGMLELISVSYDQTFTATDSTIVNVYALNVPCTDSTVLFGTYKGSNLRNGLITSGLPPYSVQEAQNNISVSVHPNPASDFLFLDFEISDMYSISITNAAGQIVFKEPCCRKKSLSIDLKNYSGGIYHLKIENAEGFVLKRVVVER